MTALVGGTVERTFSGVGRKRCGLPSPQPHEAGGQDLGDLVEPLVGGKAFWINGIRELHRKPWMRGNHPRPLLTGLIIRPKMMILNRLPAESGLGTYREHE